MPSCLPLSPSSPLALSGASDTPLGASSFSLDRLDEDVVFGGKVEFALASVGKTRSWAHKHEEEPEEESKPVDVSGGLHDLKRWIVGLQS